MTERSELVRLVAERVEERYLAPIRETMGDGTPAERTALRILAMVAEVEEELATRWITLQEAVERSGYSYDSLQRHAKDILDGEDVPEPWASMKVRKPENQPYEVQLGTVPVKPGRVA